MDKQIFRLIGKATTLAAQVFSYSFAVFLTIPIGWPTVCDKAVISSNPLRV